ncbi:STAS domain-containing protein [Candidatus Solirubrobacter pratensis]|uniref:STAS domain-containing protein n=1 Tax=Candidatus Solirubrobacter pratensis TaxID=1298857 RepID=UPI00048874D8|nr:STAS domain-containing protein [Candidatus Solirubrobacter pratensis]
MTVDAIGGTLLIVLSGALDAPHCRKFDECLVQAARSSRAVVVDLTAVETMRARAVESLVAARSRLGGRLRVIAPRGSAANAALRRAGVAHTFALHASRPYALAATS